MRSLPLLALLATGCATLPITGVEATGEPLQIDARFRTVRWTEKLKVGEQEVRDLQGRVVRVDAVFEDRPVVQVEVRWTPRQGAQPIDDEDFFRIAGDARAAEEIATYRERSLWLNRGGLVTALIGASTAVTTVTLNSRDRDSMSSSSTVMLLSGSALLIGLGAATAVIGSQQLSDDHHPVDLISAHRTATAYNDQYGHATEPLPELRLDGPGPEKIEESLARHETAEQGVGYDPNSLYFGRPNTVGERKPRNKTGMDP